MNKYVLDSSALLALLNEEPGGDVVETLLGDSVISAVNIAEVVTKLALAGMPINTAYEILCDLVLEVVPFEPLLALEVGRLAPQTKALGLSLGDRVCLATALALRYEVITADKIWGKLKLPIKIRVIR